MHDEQDATDPRQHGELRLQHQKHLHSGADVAEAKPDARISQRLRQGREHVLEPFTLMAHKPNYIPADAGNFTSHDSTVYRPQTGDENLMVDDTESQFQVGINTSLALNLFHTFDIYAAHTNRSLWQVYNREESAPSRENNQEPETWTMISSRAPCLGT